MLKPHSFKTKDVDPSANGKGTAGVLPNIPDIDRALVTLDDNVWAKMQADYLNGREKGQTTHNKYLDPYFKWMPGYTNVITGWGGHGKSQLFFELLLTRAVFDEKKSAVWPSENLPAHRFYDGLIHTLTGRPSDSSLDNHLTLPEYKNAMEFVREHFFLIDPPTGMPYSPAHILAYFERIIEKHGVEHCMYDPWNKADHTAMNKMGGIEPYLIHTLGLCTKWSQDTKQCLVITAHPKRDNENMGYGKTRPVPTGGTISGGQTWENMAHYVGAMHRPYDWIENDNRAAYFCHKSKDERYVAKRGSIGAEHDGMPPSVPLSWDTITNRYRWGHERMNPLDEPDIENLWRIRDTPPLILPSAPEPPQLKPPTPLGGAVRTRRDLDDDFQAYAEANTPPA